MEDVRQAAIREIGASMQRYQRSVQAFDDAVGRRLGLGPADLRCLDWLADGPKTAGELARGAGLRAAATTALVDRLERRGLVERRPDEADRRRILVRMTPDAEARVGALYGPLVAEGVDVFDGLGAAEIAELRRLLERMTALTDRHRARVEEDPGDPTATSRAGGASFGS
ncbi:MarR family winged helix-turn-helix transcriptional regulator [Amnibacterium setariae]|uniref:MarR family transcriptional regulator n=1 Tax=Amnibacterium setariae TaxID=2306585 RepID=A0A3A1U4G1_9MICO|nr:MarR family transcriptional regulator [Amnibacterium setariae]RIX31200.1 MarR family transcriptional regulator [Amnibacterium setariae]